MKIMGYDIPIYKIPWKAVKYIWRRFFINSYLTLRAVHYLKHRKKIKHDGQSKIKVGFIVQMAEIWDKEVDVYEELKSRNNVEVTMLVVPEYDFANKKLKTDYNENFFIKKYPDSVKALNSNGEYENLAIFDLDYIFFQRPTNSYIPAEYYCEIAIKYAKCCYIPYGYSGADIFNAGNTNEGFFRNMYFVFLESEYMKNIIREKFKKTSSNGYQHFEYLGYPSLEHFMKIKSRDEIRSIIWTPRWSYDEKIGGSHFIEYKDSFIAMKEKFPDIDFIFRPHPLMFENFIFEKRMTEPEVDEFKKEIDSKNIRYDSGTMLYEVTNNVDLVITDYSSIIINFFLTGKPIIYCESNIKFNDDYNKFRDCLYIVRNKDELEAITKELINGNDYLRKKRLELISDEFQMNIGSAKRIADAIIQDYNGSLKTN